LDIDPSIRIPAEGECTMDGNELLQSAIKQFEYYKQLGEKTFAQVDDEQLFQRFDEEANSIAILVGHLVGNMLSRWTDFLESDGEKPWRNRDQEFEPVYRSRAEMLQSWEAGWNRMLETLRSLRPEDLERIVPIRNQGHSVLEAILRQLAHYPYHVGQIVLLGRMFAGPAWVSLSIPKGGSSTFNADKFSKPLRREHFTDSLIEKPR